MEYDDLKEYEGRTYTGMQIGGRHTWHYTDAVWRERKVTPDRWDFTLTSVKKRAQPAPPGSGAPPLTEYHWCVLAHQWVRKIDEDSYHTFMAGVKYKLAHKRPHWRKWSDEYEGHHQARDAEISILESRIAELRSERMNGSAFAVLRP